jgi:hypothetical protein
MATYSEQVVFCTGKEDWVSNIEQEEDSTGDFVRGMKSVIGKGSAGFDVGLSPNHTQNQHKHLTTTPNTALHKRPHNRKFLT